MEYRFVIPRLVLHGDVNANVELLNSYIKNSKFPISEKRIIVDKFSTTLSKVTLKLTTHENETLKDTDIFEIGFNIAYIFE